MKAIIAETLETQNEIIKLQSDIIDRLAARLLQYGQMEDEDLAAIRQAAKWQEKAGLS